MKNTVPIWRGPSPVNARPLVASLTYVSLNAKTGPMAQVAVLDAEAMPTEVYKNADAQEAMCGKCPLLGPCYVNRIPYNATWRACAGVEVQPLKYNRLRSVRLGSLGDPALLPLPLLDTLAAKIGKWTGYTHQWMHTRAHESSAYLMASVDAPTEAQGHTYEKAKDLGFRTYRILTPGEELKKGEIMCPYTTRGTQCIDCGLCSGSAGKGLVDIATPAGGAPNRKHLLNGKG